MLEEETVSHINILLYLIHKSRVYFFSNDCLNNFIYKWNKWYNLQFRY